MNKIIFNIIFILAVTGTRVAFAFDDGDFQYWNTESASVKINDDLTFGIEEEFRYGDNASDFFYHHTDVGLTYSGISDWLDVGVNYRAVFEEKSQDFLFENRPHINATLKTKYNGFSLSNRSRLEFRIRDASEDKPRYRNKSSIKLPYKFSKFELQPYVADEIFIDFDSAEMTRNRLYAGFGGKLLSNLKMDIFYMLQSSKAPGSWKKANVLGTKLKFVF